MGSALGFPIETENIFIMSTVKVFQKLLDTASNLINVKTNINIQIYLNLLKIKY